MIQIEEQKRRIKETRKQISETKSRCRKRDLKKYLNRLLGELAEANNHLNAH